MHSKLNILLTLLVILLVSVTTASAQNRTNTVSEQESQEVKALLLKAINRLEETKDFSVVVDEYFTGEFPFCCQCVENEDNSDDEVENVDNIRAENLKQQQHKKDKYIIANAFGIKADIISQIPPTMIRRYFIAGYNLFYLSSYLPVGNEAQDNDYLQLEEFVRTLKGQLTKYDGNVINSKADLEQTLPILEQIALLYRQYIDKHPAPTTETYQKRFRQQHNLDDLISVTRSVTPSQEFNVDNRICFLSSKHRIIDAQVNNYVFYLTKINGQLKIVCMYPDPS